jgi:hypothetical protein
MKGYKQENERKDKIRWFYNKTIHFAPKSILFWMFLLFFLVFHIDAKTLTVPMIEEGLPEAGKRVKVYLNDYPGIYYIVFLPYNFNKENKYGVICEVSYMEFKAWTLGYGICKGNDYILVSLPILNTEGTEMLDIYYPQNPLPTANCWLSILKDLNAKFNIDNNKIILSGFSRGSVCVNYIGNCNDIISSKWAAYFTYAHFEGCCQITPGNLDERINRMNAKKILVAVGQNDLAKICSKNAYLKLQKQKLPVTYIEHPDIQINTWINAYNPSDPWINLNHNPFWILEDSDASEEARSWLKNLFIKD